MQCSAHLNKPRHGSNARQPFDSIDYEWRALNQDRAASPFPNYSEASLWDQIHLPSDLTQQAGQLEASTSTETQAAEQFWEYSPAGSTKCWDDRCRIHVILFGVSEGDPEGIYSLRAQLPGGEQLPQETIIGFEDAEDAQRYAGLLEATMEHPSSVVPINPSELLEFCRASGYHCRLERPGSQFMPPYYNVDVTDWERSLRLRSGIWDVMAEAPMSDATDTFTPYQTMFPQNNAGVYLPSDEAAAFEDMRCRLEKLMQLDN